MRPDSLLVAPVLTAPAALSNTSASTTLSCAPIQVEGSPVSHRCGRRSVTAAAALLSATVTLTACNSTTSSGPHPSAASASRTSQRREAAPATGLDAEVVALKSALTAELHAHVLPGAVVIVRRGGQTRTVTVGYADRARHKPLRVADRYRVGSVTKTLVAATTLKLVAQGRLSLHDTVDDWLPGLLAHGHDITVKELLAQTSGLPEYTTSSGFNPLLGSGHGTPRAVVGLVAHEPLLFKPGTAGSYSNTNYTTLGLILERVTGRPLNALMRQHLFKSLHMQATTVAPAGLLRPRSRTATTRGTTSSPTTCSPGPEEREPWSQPPPTSPISTTSSSPATSSPLRFSRR